MIAGGQAPRTPRVAVVTSGFPRVSETFLLQELAALERAGMLAAVLATAPGDGARTHPLAQRLAGRVTYLPSGNAAAQAADAAERLRETAVDGVHGYFAHRPAEVARDLAARLGVRWGFSTHARDARKVDREQLVERARSAGCVVACNDDVRGHFRDVPIEVVPHGVDLERFACRPLPTEDRPAHILAVGRLVPKKGFDVLIETLSRLTVPARLRIVGSGPERQRLERHAVRRRVDDRITFVGQVTHADLPAEYAAADLVVVPSVVDRHGDRDGLPNVVLEAMASGRPLVASDVGAIARVVHDHETGLLVPAGDVDALTGAVARLASDQPLRAHLARRARETVEDRFALGACTDRFLHVLRETYVRTAVVV